MHERLIRDMIFDIQLYYLETHFPDILARVSGDIVKTHRSNAPLHSAEGYFFHV